MTCNRDELIKFNSFTRAVTQICKPFILARRCAPHVPTLGSGGRAGARRGGAARRLAAAQRWGHRPRTRRCTRASASFSKSSRASCPPVCAPHLARCVQAPGTKYSHGQAPSCDFPSRPRDFHSRWEAACSQG